MHVTHENDNTSKEKLVESFFSEEGLDLLEELLVILGHSAKEINNIITLLRKKAKIHTEEKNFHAYDR